MENMTLIEKFIFNKFTKVPPWLRNLTYLLFVLLYIYLAIVPRFINIRLIARIDKTSNAELPYPGTEINTSIEGRDYKFSSNENGYVSVPVICKVPGAITLRIYHQDARAWFPVKINTMNLWKSSLLSKDIIVEIKNDPDKIDITGNFLRESAGEKRFHLINNLYAGELKINNPEIESKMNTKDRIKLKKEILEIIKTILKSSRAPGENFRLVNNNKLSFIQLIAIIKKVETEYSFKIPNEHWKNLTTAGELIDYTARRIALLNFSADRNLKVNQSFYETVEQLPKNKRPFFERNR